MTYLATAADEARAECRRWAQADGLRWAQDRAATAVDGQPKPHLGDVLEAAWAEAARYYRPHNDVLRALYVHSFTTAVRTCVEVRA